VAEPFQIVGLPLPVAAYLAEISVAARAPAFLLLTPDLRIAASGGECLRYGLAVPIGGVLPESWRFLYDFLPLSEQEESLDLPCIQPDGGVLVDIHLLRGEEGIWIILLDARAQEEQQRLIQQKTNELTLQQGQQQKLLRQYVGAGIAETLPSKGWDPSSEGERRVLTVLFADICGFTSYSEARSPGLVFRTLNDYLRAMIDPITARAGWIDKLIGDEVMALFGLLPLRGDQSVQAVEAAVEIMHRVRALHAEPDRDVALQVSVGIATGPVALGILGTKERRSFTAIGHHVNLAARLETYARPGEILIDEPTFEKLGEMRSRFAQRQLLLKGLTAPLSAFGLTLDHLGDTEDS
jgi:class 3 adenylate cyclase